jgi:anaerobic selenocysteine-containing dehydrogenase
MEFAMSDQKLIPTVCPYCGVVCRFFVTVEDDRAVGIEYMPDHPVSNGRLCAKGNAALAVLNHPDRLQHPLKKINGKWAQLSWVEALDTVAEKLQSAIHLHSAGSLGFLASAKCTNEENYLFQKLARLLGTNNIDHCARLCHSPTVVGLVRAFGNGAMTNPLSDLALSDCIFIIGSNLAENHAPALHWIWEAKDKGAKIIVADPRLTAAAWLADEFLQLKPGSDSALLGGIARLIISEGSMKRDFIRWRTSGYEAMQASLAEFTPPKVAALTGVSAEQIARAACTYARAGSASIVYCILTCPSSALHFGDFDSFAVKERRRASAEISRAQLLKGGM